MIVWQGRGGNRVGKHTHCQFLREVVNKLFVEACDIDVKILIHPLLIHLRYLMGNWLVMSDTVFLFDGSHLRRLRSGASDRLGGEIGALGLVLDIDVILLQLGNQPLEPFDLLLLRF